MRLFVDSKFVSPYALSAFVALRVKGLDVELDTIDLATRQNLDDDFFQTSVTSRVPTLIVDNFSISESSAIAEYLEELQPTPNLYPQNIQDRAKARQVQAWQEVIYWLCVKIGQPKLSSTNQYPKSSRQLEKLRLIN